MRRFTECTHTIANIIATTVQRQMNITPGSDITSSRQIVHGVSNLRPVSTWRIKALRTVRGQFAVCFGERDSERTEMESTIIIGKRGRKVKTL